MIMLANYNESFSVKRLYATKDLRAIYHEEGGDKKKLLNRIVCLAKDGIVKPVVDANGLPSSRLYDYDGIVSIGVGLALRQLGLTGQQIKKCIRMYNSGAWLPSSAGYLVGYLQTLPTGSRLTVEVNVAEIEARVDEYIGRE